MATYSSILAWRIQGLYIPWDHKESGMTELVMVLVLVVMVVMMAMMVVMEVMEVLVMMVMMPIWW